MDSKEQSFLETLRGAVIADWLNSPEHVSNWLVDSQHPETEVYPSHHAFTNTERVRQLMAELQPDGSWLDIDYLDQRREAWPVIEHFTSHLHPMVMAYAAKGAQFYLNTELKAKILCAVRFWLTRDFQNPNWWYNIIGLPAYFLGPVLLVMQHELDPDEIKKGAEILDRCDLKGEAEWRSGGNALFDCRAAIVSGLFSHDTELVARVFDEKLTQWLCITPAQGSGVKEDFSHWEHGNLLFNHGYGSLLLTEGARLLSYAAILSIPGKTEALDFLTNYLLHGSQWMERTGFLDYAADGRGVASPEAAKANKRSYLAIGARYLLRAGASREGELEDVVQRALRRHEPLTGNRCFPVSDYMTHHTPEFYASVRMSSTRTLNTEICNGANRLGYYLGTGSMYLVRRGDEYKDIFPVWDWNKIPGTTVSLAATKDHGMDEVADSGWFPQPDPEREGFGRGRLRVSRTGRTSFVGGVSDGQHGAAGLDLKILSLRASKSWFFFDTGYVCLGAGITNAEPSPVLTTLNQCHLVGEVQVIDESGDVRVLHTGTYALPGVQGVHHDGVSYIFPEPQEIVCSNQFQTGNWQRINVNQPDAHLETEVFSLSIEHGSMPVNATYCYHVLPGIALTAALDLTTRSGIEILANTRRLQAVRNLLEGITSIIFFRDGMLTLGEGRFIRVSAPCIIMLSEKKNLLCVADPTWTTEGIHVELNNKVRLVPLSRGRTTMLPLSS